MKWLAAHVFYFVVALGLLVLVHLRFRAVKPKWPAIVAAVVLVVLIGLGVGHVWFGPPIQEDTVDEEQHDGPKPDLPDSALERLRMDWNSNGIADWPVAETLAEISDICYLPPVEAAKSLNDLGFPKFMPIVQGSMLGYVVSGEDVTVIVFRGTNPNEISDWIANLGTAAERTEHGPIHRGFFNAYLSMKDQITEILKDSTTKHLWITGHSLGGALALCCAFDLLDTEKREIDGLITFGQPMVASEQLAQYLNTLLLGRYARFVNHRDIVPKVPPDYHDCGSLVWFTDSGIRRFKPSIAYGAPPSDLPPSTDIPLSDKGDESELKPLTQDEFRQLQAKLKAENASKERLPEGTPMTYQAVSSPIDDHSMWLYVSEVRTLLGVTSATPPQ